ncbi:MAG: hypothetical protein PHO85_05855, partial [Candidatus Cloacimonetes bacterium]|nr:hypothetical protein [Candidatus Cloacimonadota bacterium]
MMQSYNTLKELDFERLAGSAGEMRAIEVISGYLAALNLHPNVEEFALKSFDAGRAEIVTGNKRWDAIPFGLCSDVVLKSALVYLENLDILPHSLGAYEGK